MGGALLTDLYELKMAESYLRHSMTDQATFSLFARKLPSGRGFLVTAGLADCLDFLENPDTADAGALFRLADALQTTVHELLGGDQDRPPGWSWL
ncbi:hypothetical protein [Nonomuraea sp. CA-141351]|uniref:hypothetical protein n=1 Tax=Nonomuraea sp. CA-141351 TaxID=3239996 RepID=UPI003D8CB6FA